VGIDYGAFSPKHQVCLEIPRWIGWELKEHAKPVPDGLPELLREVFVGDPYATGDTYNIPPCGLDFEVVESAQLAVAEAIEEGHKSSTPPQSPEDVLSGLHWPFRGLLDWMAEYPDDLTFIVSDGHPPDIYYALRRLWKPRRFTLYIAGDPRSYIPE